MRKKPAMRKSKRDFKLTISPTRVLLAPAMPKSNNHEEIKVQKAIDLIDEFPSTTMAHATRVTRCSYSRLTRRMRGIPASNSRGGHNKKLTEVEDDVLKDYLLFNHALGRSARIDNVVAAGNSILRCKVGFREEPETVSRRWAKR